MSGFQVLDGFELEFVNGGAGRPQSVMDATDGGSTYTGTVVVNSGGGGKYSEQQMDR